MTTEAMEALLATPFAGTMKHTENPRLAGLRILPIKGFDAFRIYYLTSNNMLTIVRVLHGKRDIGTILEQEEYPTPPPVRH